MREKFENRNLHGSIKIKMDEAKGYWIGDKNTVVNAIIDIAEEYDDGGYVLTLRQLYYQLVSRDIIPNHDKVYSKISSIKDDVVYSGLVDWDVFEDRGRVPILAYFEENIPNALQRTIDNYHLDRQLGQTNHVEVWTEKDAISSILRRVTDSFTIRLVINKGYTSSTAIHQAYERFIDVMNEGKTVTILYFGDHDPSGMDMIRDIYDRLMFMFVNGERKDDYNMANVIESWSADIMDEDDLPDHINDNYDTFMDADGFNWTRAFFYTFFKVVPVGLTMQQIKLYQPPPNPAKITDPRAKGYIKKYGAISWEVDALKPDIMIEIVKNAILENISVEQFNSVIERENDEISQVKTIIESLDNQ